MNRQQVIDEARKWLGTPFHHQGRLLGVGVDCVGIVSETGRALGLTTHDNTTYSQQPDGSSLVAHLREAGLIETSVEEMQVGDILVFRIKRDPQHLAILSREAGVDGPEDIGMIIHAHMGIENVIETHLAQKWFDHIVHVFRIPGVE